MVLNKFRNVAENYHDYAREWKSRTGGKVCGCICGNVPEEIIYAAGLLPVRILGEHKSRPTLALSHIPDNKCTYGRDCLEQALLGRYDYIDGLAYTRCCLSTALTFSSWLLHVPVAWSHRMLPPFFPEKRLASDLYIECLENLRSSLEEWLGSPISKEALAQSVDTYKTNRQLMTQVYELRKAHPPLISGSDATRIVLASMLMDKKEHNDLLQQFLQEKHEPREASNGRPRVMVIGSGYDPVDFMELVESLGGDVVTDDHCLGLRYFWGNPVTDEDPMDAIASYYFREKPPCPTYDCMFERRLPRLHQLVKEYDVQAIVFLSQAFCWQEQWDRVDVANIFEKEGIPVLILSRDIPLPPAFRTRVEAMLENVKRTSVT